MKLEIISIMYAVIKTGYWRDDINIFGVYPTRAIANKEKGRLKKRSPKTHYYVRITRVFGKQKGRLP